MTEKHTESSSFRFCSESRKTGRMRDADIISLLRLRYLKPPSTASSWNSPLISSPLCSSLISSPLLYLPLSSSCRPRADCSSLAALPARCSDRCSPAALINPLLHSSQISSLLSSSSVPTPLLSSLVSASLSSCLQHRASALRRSKASLVVLECHLWLTLTEIKDTDKAVFLDSPVSPTGLFGPDVDGFPERFTAAQKLSQAM
ncbi:hypothetical protein DPX16_22354 [Anabarilius grahami]|uniref:Uncharacterized protein n=1 Tax=Anabarilius grahami TaxID=495550 RepID=A0A3N0YRK5_ANAGA|nr:hypothetical protein DPX16_22354 [Anabarilius grahami]